MQTCEPKTTPTPTALIPPPPIVRARLAEHIAEGRLLRSLLRLSIRAAEERHRAGPRAQDAGRTGAVTR